MEHKDDFTKWAGLDTEYGQSCNKIKELSFCHEFYFSNLFIFATQCRRPLIFQTMNSVRPNNLSLKYQRFTSSDCKDIGIRQFVYIYMLPIAPAGQTAGPIGLIFFVDTNDKPRGVIV